MKNRMIITELEKKRILTLHSKKRIINEATMSDFPFCVRNAGIIETGETEDDSWIKVKNAGGQGIHYWWGPSSYKVWFKGRDLQNSEFVGNYYCKCKNGKCSPVLTDQKGKEDECKGHDSCKTQGGDTQTPNTKGICKLPGDKIWVYKKEGDLWYASKDGGKTWIKLDPTKFKSAIDLLNKSAVCDGNQTQTPGGTLPTNPGGTLPTNPGGTLPEDGQSAECKAKCSAVPGSYIFPIQGGQTGPQVQGWFFSKDGVCYEATGTGGFTSKEACEACKCKKPVTLIPGKDGIPGKPKDKNDMFEYWKINEDYYYREIGDQEWIKIKNPGTIEKIKQKVDFGSDLYAD